jgi:hypothetical protein
MQPIGVNRKQGSYEFYFKIENKSQIKYRSLQLQVIETSLNEERQFLLLL